MSAQSQIDFLRRGNSSKLIREKSPSYRLGQHKRKHHTLENQVHDAITTTTTTTPHKPLGIRSPSTPAWPGPSEITTKPSRLAHATTDCYQDVRPANSSRTAKDLTLKPAILSRATVELGGPAEGVSQGESVPLGRVRRTQPHSHHHLAAGGGWEVSTWCLQMRHTNCSTSSSAPA